MTKTVRRVYTLCICALLVVVRSQVQVPPVPPVPSRPAPSTPSPTPSNGNGDQPRRTLPAVPPRPPPEDDPRKNLPTPPPKEEATLETKIVAFGSSALMILLCLCALGRKFFCTSTSDYITEDDKDENCCLCYRLLPCFEKNHSKRDGDGEEENDSNAAEDESALVTVEPTSHVDTVPGATAASFESGMTETVAKVPPGLSGGSQKQLN